MQYLKKDMFYSGYEWKAGDDFDDPKFLKYQEHSELNRSEGYEMLWFINYCAKAWNWPDASLIMACQTLEKAIQTKVPSTIRTHSGIKTWIELHFKSFWSSL